MLQEFAKMLVDGVEKYLDKRKYWISNLGEDMRLYIHQDNKERLLVNAVTGNKIMLVDAVGGLVNITKTDIDFESVNRLENSHNAQRLYSPYFFGVDPYVQGVAMVTWTLYPDGRYFADEDGYGGENNEETNIYAFINRAGKIIIPFKGMEHDEFDCWRRKAWEKEAEV